MSFQAFTEELLAWAHWWNTEHRPAELDGATPLEAWQSDPTPLNDVPAQDVWSFTLEDDGRRRTITSHGVRFRNRDYLADWMTGQAGRTVTVRFMPHHDHEIEICDAHSRHLGTAYLADAATPEQLSALRQARSRRAHRLRAEAKAAEKLRVRFAPATVSQKTRRLDALTSSQAEAELARDATRELSDLALPDVIPPAAPPADWRTPPSLATRTTPGRPSPVLSEPAADGPPAPTAQTAEDGDAS
nr:Mu transposase C-terminal domain-containing protein [Streptomyces oceani]